LILHGSSQLGWAVCGNISVASVGEGLSEGLASAINTSVWVRILSGDAIILNVVEGIVHETTIAAHIAIGGRAVDQLLLGEGDEAA